ncbi:MAG: precorrin-6y C5,15-methyltransferase (decarboxylating) subunit CbiE [Nitrospirae bacterium]|nr:precorrin-6y C5,15-methyltransferase (decarboxylating) subunit CbiE [Nitrospirota bacterium]
MGEHAPRILVVGIPPNGPEGMPASLLKRIADADVLCGGKRQLALFPGIGQEQWPIQKNLDQFVTRIRGTGCQQRIVVLASGDPLLFGIGSYLRKHLPTERCEFIPHVSTVQEAFARIGEPWEDAVIISVHARPLEQAIIAVRMHRKVAVLTDETNTPARLAEALLAAGVPDCRVVVAEDLGLPTERVTDALLTSIRQSCFSGLNVVLILQQEESRTLLLGIPDAELAHRDGMITRQEVRAIALSWLGLTEGSLVWDIGAGSGSISIEAGRLATKGRVFAIERDHRQAAYLAANLRRHAANVTVVYGEAPGILSTLPDPDAVLIGGSGGKLVEILNTCWKRLRVGGHIVVNLVLLDHLTEAWAWCQRNQVQPEIALVQVSKARPLSDSFRFEGTTPVYLLGAVRQVST